MEIFIEVFSHFLLQLTELTLNMCLELPTGSLEKSLMISSQVLQIPVANSTKQR
ncbi:histocompatibility minor serpin domain containing [Homo sapiens]|uniref:Minor histocompatibility protein HMSD variant form n=1 Tax=Homo sapiens TaxID=9606 RepID=HMSDV_HUMAN|nr:RecName: Full=Minor histocompatibility protein HMSD variant form; Short=HSMD-v; Contains: RecName: Full=Minor histocompatibility antigen ACC-6; Short=mHA ACC-6 [Homo sapiens]KAI2587216.1 histocompatibility minor serpin domain containing [Homo sapiens]KAI4046647.1 histocompatibility minor serpin domain containing [Homo sapiens]